MMLNITRDLDTVLGANVNFMLGPWIADARARANTSAQADNRELNARNILTLWGPGATDGSNSIDDYAAKHWQGLVGDYYYGRWDLQSQYVLQSLATQTEANWTQYSMGHLAFEQAFTYETVASKQYPVTPSGDPLTQATAMLAKWAAYPASDYVAFPNTDEDGELCPWLAGQGGLAGAAVACSAGCPADMPDCSSLKSDECAPAAMIAHFIARSPFGFAGAGIFQMWNADEGVIQLLCSAAPACACANSNGWLKPSAAYHVPFPGSTLWVKASALSGIKRAVSRPVYPPHLEEAVRASGILDRIVPPGEARSEATMGHRTALRQPAHPQRHVAPQQRDQAGRSGGVPVLVRRALEQLDAERRESGLPALGVPAQAADWSLEGTMPVLSKTERTAQRAHVAEAGEGSVLFHPYDPRKPHYRIARNPAFQGYTD